MFWEENVFRVLPLPFFWHSLWKIPFIVWYRMPGRASVLLSDQATSSIVDTTHRTANGFLIVPPVEGSFIVTDIEIVTGIILSFGSGIELVDSGKVFKPVIDQGLSHPGTDGGKTDGVSSSGIG